MSSDSLPMWKQSFLWKLLEERTSETDPVRQNLQLCMPKIESVLAKGGTGLPDFTLHDADHGFRVAKTMFDLMPVSVRSDIGSFEIALLLLAAYLHDIGMTPKRDVVQRHYRYVQTVEPNLLSDREIEELRAWLDEEHSGLMLPVSKGPPTVNDIDLADYIVAYYCRHRHNDWSEEWIRTELSDISPSLYPSWIQDVVTLCRSHHEGLHELRAQRFDAKIVGSPAQVVNLRYLAALLRVSDILEFDPERTPEIILKHRNIAPKSKIYWAKDHGIAMHIDGANRDIIIAAQTPNAQIHRAVLDTVDAVNGELYCCDALRHQNAYLRGTIPNTHCTYDWPWPARVTEDIRERDNSFSYIEGAFRPDAHRVLGLLSGTGLYRDRLAAVRELVQNAFDAVNEQIAWQRLARSPDETNDPAFVSSLRATHKVVLKLDSDGNSHWLSCSDTGVGMTKKIIERYLLISGSGQRPDIATLERFCRTRGFALNRIGQFGIGVLSYFMLGDQMSILTRRSDDARDDPDRSAWRFDIEGLRGFGQLTPYTMAASGTEVRLRLRPEVVGPDASAWVNRIIGYLQRTLIHIPCPLSVRAEGRGAPSVEYKPAGWVPPEEHFFDQLLSKFHTQRYYVAEGEIRPSSEFEASRRLAQRWQECKEEARARLRLYGPIETVLDNGLARYRLHLPYFELDGGASFLFMRVAGNKGKLLPEGSTAIACNPVEVHGLRGIAASSTPERYSPSPSGMRLSSATAVLAIDWLKGGISVDRATLDLDPGDLEAVRMHVARDVARLVHRFLDEKADSKYAALNRAFVLTNLEEQEIAPSKELFTAVSMFDAKRRSYHWDAVRRPFVELIDDIVGDKRSIASVEFGDAQCTHTSVVTLPGYREFVTPLLRVPGKRLVLLQNTYDIIPVLQLASVSHSAANGIGFEAQFPPEWEHLCAVANVGSMTLWNSAHPLVRLVDWGAWKWVVATVVEGDPRQHIDQIRQDPRRMAAWLLRCINLKKSVTFWKGIVEQVPDLLSSLTSRMPLERQDQPIRIWNFGHQFGSSSETLEISAVNIGFLDFQKRTNIAGKGLVFASGLVLPWPETGQWFGTIVRHRDTETDAVLDAE